MQLAAEFGTGQVFWSMMWFFLFFIWIWMLMAVFADLFRDRDLSGWAKAAWSVFIIVAPYLGVFVYLIVRGRKMSENAQLQAQRNDEAMRGYIRSAVDTPQSSSVDELVKLASLRDKGVIDDAEFQRMKAKITGTTTASATGAAGDVPLTART